MEDIINAVIAEVEAFAQTQSEDGGCADILQLNAVYFGDPGIVPVRMYPCAMVDASSETPISESTGHDRRKLSLIVSLNIDAREYFDKDADEALGDRALVRASFALGRWFRRREARTLGGLVLDTKVEDIDFTPIQRGPVITKSSRTTLVIDRTYPRA